MLNLVVQTGRLTRDPELRHTKNDQMPVTSFSIAVKRDYVRKGEPETDFFDIIAWRGTAEFIGKWFTKGSLITVVGNLQNRSWKDKHDQNRINTEIIAQKAHFGESKGKDENGVNGEMDIIDPYYTGELPAPDGQAPAPPIGADTAPPPDFDPFG